jgi:hypothetical protein
MSRGPVWVRVRNHAEMKAVVAANEPAITDSGKPREYIHAVSSEPAPASSVAVAPPSSPALTTIATLLPAPPSEAMTISQPSTYSRKAGCLPRRAQDHRRQVTGHHRIPVILGRCGPHYLANPMSSALS